MTQMNTSSSAEARSPSNARRIFDRLEGRRETIQSARDDRERQRRDKAEYLTVADDIKLALEAFSDQLFSELVEALQSQLTKALQDVLDQPIELKIEREIAKAP